MASLSRINILLIGQYGPMGKFHVRRPMAALLTTLAAVLALVAPVHPATSTAAPADPSAAAAQVEPAVARIDTELDYQSAIGNGTGIVIDPGGLVLTNFHVVTGADRIRATVGGRSYPAQLVGYDRRGDIAVLQLLGAGGLPAAPIGNSAQLAEGEPVVALGNAQGTDAPLTREVGIVTGFGRSVSAEDTLTGSTDEMTGLIEFAAPVVAGDSGGPVVNGAGQVVGVTTAASVNYRIRSRRRRLCDPDQRRNGDRRADSLGSAIGFGTHWTAGVARGRGADGSRGTSRACSSRT